MGEDAPDAKTVDGESGDEAGSPEPRNPEPRNAEQVYSAPAEALESARLTLASTTADPADRAEALWVLGRAAYYANQMSDAVRLLQDAVPLVNDPGMLTEILLTLAPALSKEGHPDHALQLLETPSLELEPRYAGQLRNQRGIVLTELGRLPEALDQMKEAIGLLEAAGDDSRQSRTLVNLGAVSSMMGRLAESEKWYGLAREKTLETGQHVVAAGIEGNLGYVESRRGNFAKALDWYGRARDGFDGFGDVGLLVAVLEVDHARTLLDVGLAADAAEAAERAAGSATAGGNQMLETQSRLLLAEALIRLGEQKTAEQAIRRGEELAEKLGQEPWLLRAAALRSNLASESDLPDDDGSELEIEVEVEQFLRAGWVREAYESVLQRAGRERHRNPERAKELLIAAEKQTTGLDVDPVDRALGALLLAAIAEDDDGAAWAFDNALDALAEQRDMLGSVEVRATITQRVRPIRDAALTVALRSTSPADAVLDVLERTRAVRDAHTGGPRAEDKSNQLGELRNARVALEEAKLEGGDVEGASNLLREIERSMLRNRRTVSASKPGNRDSTEPIELALPPETGFATFIIHEHRILGITRVAGSTSLVDLGPLGPVQPVVRAQRAALRRLGDERRRSAERDLERLRQANDGLDSLLLKPLALASAKNIVLAPPAPLRDITWSALPSISNRPVTIAPTFRAWQADPEPAKIRQVSLLGGPDILSGMDELDQIKEFWHSQVTTSADQQATSQAALRALATADLVHVAAHGSFRVDNPFFSSLVFSDGQLSIFEMSELETLPAVVVLSSCDAAAAATTGNGDDLMVGTATELRHLGARVVVAPSVAVNDAATGELSVLLHRGLSSGLSIDNAMLKAKDVLLQSGDGPRVAAAQAFQVFGGRVTGSPLAVMGG